MNEPLRFLFFVATVVACLATSFSGQVARKQALVETSVGTFVIDLASDAAPNHVAYFMKVAQEGGYDGTIFHRAVRYGMVQGGDPVSKDPAKRSQYGTGGLNMVKAEARAAAMTRGSVAAVEAIEATPRTGETPNTRIDLKTVRVVTAR